MKWTMVQRNPKKKVIQHKHESEVLLKKFAFLTQEELFQALETGREGLTEAAAEEIRDEVGVNVIVAGKKQGPLYRLIHALINPFNIVLFVVSAITFVTDVVVELVQGGAPDYTTFSIILIMVLLSSAIAFFQGERSSNAAACLSKMISNKADVWRDGKLEEIDITQIVPGDVVRLSAGDMIPGDVRFLSTKDTFVSQSALTGESAPLEKFAKNEQEAFEALTDLENIGFMGSNVISGSATAVVLATGNRTFFGSMAESLSGDKAKNSFERGVDSVSRLLIWFMVILVPIIFLVNGLIKGQWWSSLLFAVAIAVGLTPEMLPMIITSTLARGAVMMSRQKTIVKNLSAIQTFGEMDILCTDKTGTLTEDKIILERYMDVHGRDDMRVLRDAYLNSTYQTGLKNLIDLAIIERAKKQNLEEILLEYTRVDEIPFDFTRRRMSVVLANQEGERQLITKGAVEEVMSICSFVELKNGIVPLDDAQRADAMRVYEQHNRDGLRVVAVAQKNDVANVDVFGVSDENDMVLIGFVGFLDPPKESAAEAISALREHGVRTVVLTGDSEGVAVKVCQKVGIQTVQSLTGRDVEAMNDEDLCAAVQGCSLFSKLSPTQKQRIVACFQKMGHTVGYMGDGINDAAALRQADVGISVDSGVDIAKETADIILLKKDLMVLEQGVIGGRRTFGNIVKYIKMAASGNFGNMISVLVASIFLPIMPMLSVHILTQNLLCDLSQIGIPFDSVDREYQKKPCRWDPKSIFSFMMVMGPISSVFDVLCFVVLAKLYTPMEHSLLFQTGWFVFGTLSQILVVHMIRTRKIPFFQSTASLPLVLSSIILAILGILISFTPLSEYFKMTSLTLGFAPWLLLLLVGYCMITQFSKRFYVKKFGAWL